MKSRIQFDWVSHTEAMKLLNLRYDTFTKVITENRMTVSALSPKKLFIKVSELNQLLENNIFINQK